jgi:hypothetical protein
MRTLLNYYGNMDSIRVGIGRAQKTVDARVEVSFVVINYEIFCYRGYKYSDFMYMHVINILLCWLLTAANVPTFCQYNYDI